MRTFLILPGLCLILAPYELLDRLAARSLFLQSYCSKLFIQSLEHGNLASSFICGTPIGNFQEQQLFTQTGLIHLMVVSGSHLILLTQLVSWFASPPQRSRPWFSSFIMILLMSYSFVTGFQAPVVRSLAGLLTQKVSHYFRWNWDSARCQCFASLCLLALSPLWIQSFSFYLSWLAASGLCLSPLVLKSRRWQQAFSSLTIQILIAPVLSTFSCLSLAMNILIVPLVGLFLFPISLAGLIFPFLRSSVDRVWDYFLAFLEQILSWVSLEHLPSLPLALALWNWLFLAGFIALLHFLRRKRYENTPV